MSAEGLAAATQKMRADGLGQVPIDVFARYYRQVEDGVTGLIDESEIEPLAGLPHIGAVDVDPAVARDAFGRTVVIKLNGGLGTSMGLDQAKSLLPVKGALTFLDIIIGQVIALRAEHGARLPLLFMNSFRTRDATRAVAARYPELATDGLPEDFLQHREPKLLAADLTPVSWPADLDLEWCPPGHGDLYAALHETGLLDAFLDQGYRYVFVSNSDNLGAVPDPRIAGWMAAEAVPFALESTLRTPADRKGGHLARRRSDGQLMLRETAQTSEQDKVAMQDLTRHKFCNTNNLWFDIAVLRDELTRTDGVLDLPLIRNRKPVDPSDSSSPEVIQIETAMGAAVQVVAGARSVLVDRDRFLPVKTTNDLLVVRSDVYELDDRSRLARSAARAGADDPLVDLDPGFYKLIHDFDAHFPKGPPSLVAATGLRVCGDVVFGANVRVVGDVTVDGGSVADATVLE